MRLELVYVTTFGTMSKGQMEKPRINIREAFSDFVEAFGGVVTDRTIRPNTNMPKNADYVFHEHSVVAELKCLEEELEGKEDFVEKRGQLVKEWLNRKLVNPAQVSGPMIYTKNFPEECQRDLVKLYGRSIKSHLRSANAQIRQTVHDLTMSEVKGLLLLANDGNYALEAQNVLVIMKRLLNTDDIFPFINTIVYFTPNMPVQMSDGSIGPLWMHLWRDRDTGIPFQFLNDLNCGWAEFHGKLRGVPIGVTSYVNEEGIAPNNLVNETKLMKR